MIGGTETNSQSVKRVYFRTGRYWCLVWLRCIHGCSTFHYKLFSMLYSPRLWNRVLCFKSFYIYHDFLQTSTRHVSVKSVTSSPRDAVPPGAEDGQLTSHRGPEPGSGVQSVTMLSVGGIFLQLPLRRLCVAARPSAGLCGLTSPHYNHNNKLDLYSAFHGTQGHLSGILTTSPLRTVSPLWPPSGVRTVSGPGGGWYGGLSDSAPVHLCEHFLVGVQQASGLPWWLSIVVATLSVRTVITLPLAAYQMVIIGKVEALQEEISKLAKALRYQVSVRGKERGWTENQSRIQFKKNLRRIVSQLYIRDNCHPFKASVLVWVQLPLWISLSLALRNLSLDQADLGLAAGGALWFPDLTAPDSTWILPVLLGLTNLFIVEVFSLQRVNPSRLQKVVTNAIRGFSVVMVPIAATVPSSMALYWLCSSLMGLTHNLFLRSTVVHRMLKIRKQKSETPYRDLVTAFKAKYLKNTS